MLSKLIVEILQEKVMYVKVHHFSYVHIKRNRFSSNVIKLSKNKHLEFYLATGKALFLMKYFFSYE